MTPKDEHENQNGDQLYAALAESPYLNEEHLRRVLDSLPAPVSYVDTECRFRYNNNAYDRWVGRSTQWSRPSSPRTTTGR